MKKLAKKIRDKRQEAKRLKKRRHRLTHVIADKVDERQKLVDERQELRDKREKLKQRNPKSEAREALLRAQIREMHEEIMRKGEEAQQLHDRLGRLRPRRRRVIKEWRKARRAIRRLTRRAGPARAIRAAGRDLGKTEQPPGSNWGGVVKKMILFTGYLSPVYWCGCAFAWWTIKKAGAACEDRIRRGYAGFIAADARAGKNGLKEIPHPRPGCGGTLWGYEHIALIVKDNGDGTVTTREGNTSPAPGSGSESNGGGCYERVRRIADFDIFVMPAY